MAAGISSRPPIAMPAKPRPAPLELPLAAANKAPPIITATMTPATRARPTVGRHSVIIGPALPGCWKAMNRWLMSALRPCSSSRAAQTKPPCSAGPTTIIARFNSGTAEITA